MWLLPTGWENGLHAMLIWNRRSQTWLLFMFFAVQWGKPTCRTLKSLEGTTCQVRSPDISWPISNQIWQEVSHDPSWPVVPYSDSRVLGLRIPLAHFVQDIVCYPLPRKWGDIVVMTIYPPSICLGTIVQAISQKLLNVMMTIHPSVCCPVLLCRLFIRNYYT